MNIISRKQSNGGIAGLPDARTAMAVLSPRVLRTQPTDIQHAALINLDNSASMLGSFDLLRATILQFLEQMRADAAIRSSMLMAWGQFGRKKALEVSGPFTTVQELVPPQLECSGGTPLGERIVCSVDVLLAARKLVQTQLHLDQRHGWLIEITDGQPGDNFETQAREAVRKTALENGIEVHFFGVGPDADMDFLHSIEQPGRPAKLLDSETNFADLFSWLKKSFAAVSRSMPGEILEIPAIDGSLIRTE